MLANDHRSSFAGAEIFRQKQITPSEHIRPNIKDHLIADPRTVFAKLPRARIDRTIRGGETADDIIPQDGLELASDGPPIFRRVAPGLLPEKLVPDVLGQLQELLGVIL